MKTVTLEVTQQNIDRAIEWKRKRNAPGLLSCNCPLARAGRRKFHNKSQVWGGRMIVSKTINGESKNREFTLDSAGVGIMSNFDSCRYNLVKPCTVVLTKIGR